MNLRNPSWDVDEIVVRPLENAVAFERNCLTRHERRQLFRELLLCPILEWRLQTLWAEQFVRLAMLRRTEPGFFGTPIFWAGGGGVPRWPRAMTPKPLPLSYGRRQ